MHQRALAVRSGARQIRLDAHRHLRHRMAVVLKLAVSNDMGGYAEKTALRHIPAELLASAGLNHHLTKVCEARGCFLEFVDGDLDLLKRGSLLRITSAVSRPRLCIPSPSGCGGQRYRTGRTRARS